MPVIPPFPAPPPPPASSQPPAPNTPAPSGGIYPSSHHGWADLRQSVGRHLVGNLWRAGRLNGRSRHLLVQAALRRRH